MEALPAIAVVCDDQIASAGDMLDVARRLRARRSDVRIIAVVPFVSDRGLEVLAGCGVELAEGCHLLPARQHAAEYFQIGLVLDHAHSDQYSFPSVLNRFVVRAGAPYKNPGPYWHAEVDAFARGFRSPWRRGGRKIGLEPWKDSRRGVTSTRHRC